MTEETPGWVSALIALLALVTLVPIFYLLAEALR